MNIWNKVVLGTKFLFGGFESATDYLLKLLNEFLGSGSVSSRVKKALDYVNAALACMVRYEKYCPAIWAQDYLALEKVVRTLADALADSKVTREEVEKAVADVKAAIAEWMK